MISKMKNIIKLSLIVTMGFVLLIQVSSAVIQIDATNNGTFGDFNGISKTNWISQSFTAINSGDCCYLNLSLWENNVVITRDLRISLYLSDASDNPTGSELAAQNFTAASVSLTPGWHFYNFSSLYTISSGTKYVIVAKSNETLNYYAWRDTTVTDHYTGGKLGTSSDNGSSWLIYSVLDNNFEVWINGSGIAPTYNVNGYVKDNISGVGLNGVTVQNGTNSTTTNSTGWYNIAMSNGTYNFTYSLAGRITNYSLITVNGADVSNNVNLSNTTKYVYYVRTDGNDNNNGTVNSSGGAFLTVQKCASTANAGDTCRIQNGTYNESNIVFTNNGISISNITVVGDGAPVVNGSDTVFNINKNFITLTGLNINSSSSKCYITNCLSANQTIIPTVKLSSVNNITIQNNTISSNGFNGLVQSNPESGGYTPAIYVLSSSNSSIVNNTINTQNINSEGVNLDSSQNINVSNNTIDARHGFSIYVSGSISQHYNNTILNNTDPFMNGNIYYYYNVSNTTLDFSNVIISEIFASYSDNMTIKNISITNGNGIIIDHITNSTVNNYSLTRTYTGNNASGGLRYGMDKYADISALTLVGSSYNNLTNITVSSGGRHNYGIYFFSGTSEYNVIDNFNFYVWSVSVSHGATGGSIDSHDDGLELTGNPSSAYNTISNTNITDNKTWSRSAINDYTNNGGNKYINVTTKLIGGTDQGNAIRSNNTLFRGGSHNSSANTVRGFIMGGFNTYTNYYDITINNTYSDDGSLGTYYDYGCYVNDTCIRVSLINVNSGDKVNMPSPNPGTYTNQHYERGYYLDVNVTNISGNPVSGATVVITNEVDDVGYPTLDINLNNKSTFVTDSSGHLPLPTGNESNSPVVRNYYQTVTNQTIINRQNFTYSVNVSSGSNYTLVTGVNPNITWFRKTPNIPTYSINVLLNQGTLSQTLDNDTSLFWVRTDGNNSCNGQNNMGYGSGNNQNLTDCAWQTINYSTSILTAGQTVRVQAGNYSSNSQINLAHSGNASSPIKFIADGKVIIGYDYTKYGFYDNGYQYITIDGFTINRTKGIFLDDYSHNNTIINNSVYNSISTGIYARRVNDSIIKNNLVDSFSSWGLALNIANNDTIQNNTVCNCGGLTPTDDYAFKYDFTRNSNSANNIAYNTTHTWRIRNNNSNNVFINETSYNALNFGLEIDNTYSTNSNENNTFRNWTIDGAKSGYGTLWHTIAGIKVAARSNNNTFENFTITNINGILTSPNTGVYVGSTWSYVSQGYDKNQTTGGYENWESIGNVFNNINVSNSSYMMYFEAPQTTVKNFSSVNNTNDYYLDIAMNETITDTINTTYKIKFNTSNTSNSVIVNYTNTSTQFKRKNNSDIAWNYVIGTTSITNPASSPVTISTSSLDIGFLSKVPTSPVVTSNLSVTQTFSAETNITANYSWKINGTEVQTNNSVSSASYTNSTAGIGTYNVTLDVSNTGGYLNSTKWTWTVTSNSVYSVSGYVNDTLGASALNVLVINGTNQSTTNSLGYYQLTGMTPGTYNLTLNKTGFYNGSIVITITASNLINQNGTIYHIEPGQVTGLTNTTVTSTTISLQWDTITGANYYRVFRNNSLIAYVNSSSYQDSNLLPSTLYQYMVGANDTYNNWGLNSTILNVTTSNTVTITVPLNSWGMFNNWTLSNETFSQIATNESNDIAYSYYNTTSGLWEDYLVGYSVNSADVIPNTSSVMGFFNAPTALTLNTVTPSNTNLIAGWNMLYVEGTSNRTLSEIQTNIQLSPCTVNAIYRYNSTTNAYSNTGTESLQVNEGFLAYINSNCLWARSTI